MPDKTTEFCPCAEDRFELCVASCPNRTTSRERRIVALWSSMIDTAAKHGTDRVSVDAGALYALADVVESIADAVESIADAVESMQEGVEKSDD